MRRRVHKLSCVALASAWATAATLVLSATAIAAPTAVMEPSVVVGSEVTVSTAGWAPGARVAVRLEPSENVGGNYCGVVAIQDQPTDASGAGQLRFPWPASYGVSAGTVGSGSRPWRDGQAATVYVEDATAPAATEGAVASTIVRLSPPVPTLGPAPSGPSPVATPSADLSAANAVRPQLRFDSSEPWRPLDVEQMFATDRPRACLLGSCRSLAAPVGLERFSALDLPGSVDDRDSYQSADPRCRQHGLSDCDAGPASAMYVNATSDGGYRYFDFWWYLRFNHGPFAGLRRFEHESDWEGVTVAQSLSSNGSVFDFAAFAAHDGVYRYLRDALTCGGQPCAGGGRIDVFSANGTHASYPRPCSRRQPFSCHQTGMPIPEAGFDGQRPWAANSLAAVLKSFPPAGANTWVDWTGDWGSGDDARVASPARQERFRAPSTVTCSGRYAEGTSLSCELDRLGAQASQVEDPCTSWTGPFVAAAACEPAALRQQLASGGLGAAGIVTLRLADGRAASGGAVAQVLRSPLRGGERLLVEGQPGPDTELVVRAADSSGASVRTSQFRLTGPGTVVATRTRGIPTLSLRLANGVERRPASSSVERLGRPRRPTRVSARRRGSRVVLTLRAHGTSVVIESRRLRGGRSLTSLTRRTRSGRVARLSVPVSKHARYLGVATLDRHGDPSSVHVTRIRSG